VPEHGIIYRGRKIEHYLKKATSKSSDTVQAFYRIGEFGRDSVAAVRLLNDGLRNESAEVRAAAITSLGEIGAADTKVIEGLIVALGDQDSRIGGLSALAFKAIGPKAAAAVTKLSEALDDPVESVRISVANALGAIGPAAAPAAHALARRIVDANEGRFVFRESMWHSARLGPMPRMRYRNCMRWNSGPDLRV
jgi:hypothetical protein